MTDWKDSLFLPLQPPAHGWSRLNKRLVDKNTFQFFIKPIMITMFLMMTTLLIAIVSYRNDPYPQLLAMQNLPSNTVTLKNSNQRLVKDSVNKDGIHVYWIL